MPEFEVKVGGATEWVVITASLPGYVTLRHWRNALDGEGAKWEGQIELPVAELYNGLKAFLEMPDA
ncbi:MAG TPA: hypothetical protein ACFYED_00025 [Candidatus Tripitaka californicus]|uniref:hypothetical protein n=1 Tax=Candidatus Tripitaka californicus TaxID=3367616 RepID=UPI0040287A4B